MSSPTLASVRHPVNPEIDGLAALLDPPVFAAVATLLTSMIAVSEATARDPAFLEQLWRAKNYLIRLRSWQNEGGGA